jgi:ankyrin repeat protein
MKDAPLSCRTATLPEDKKVSQSPIMQAIFERNSTKLKQLIESGEDVHVKDALGFSYLHLAAGVGDVDAIQILINAGIPVNIKGGHKKSTPAHSAVAWGKTNSLQALARAGADFSISNVDGKTPAALAVDLEKVEVIEFFRNKR